MNPIKLIRNIAKTFFPAFVIGMAICTWEMTGTRPFLALGLLLVCIGMTLACANLEVWASAKLEGENKNGRSNQSNRKTA